MTNTLMHFYTQMHLHISLSETTAADGRRLGNLKAVRFKDASNGLAIGDNGVVILTSDGGATWTFISLFNDKNAMPDLT